MKLPFIKFVLKFIKCFLAPHRVLGSSRNRISRIVSRISWEGPKILATDACNTGSGSTGIASLADRPTDRTGDGPDTRPPRPLSGEHGELRVAAPGQDVSLFVCATVRGTTVTKLGWSLPHGIWSPIIPSSWRNPGPPPPASRPLAIPGRPPWPTDRRQRIAIPHPPRNTVWSSTRRAPC